MTPNKKLRAERSARPRPSTPCHLTGWDSFLPRSGVQPGLDQPARRAQDATRPARDACGATAKICQKLCQPSRGMFPSPSTEKRREGGTVTDAFLPAFQDPRPPQGCDSRRESEHKRSFFAGRSYGVRVSTGLFPWVRVVARRLGRPTVQSRLRWRRNPSLPSSPSRRRVTRFPLSPERPSSRS